MKFKFTLITLAATVLLMGSSPAFADKKFKFDASGAGVFDPLETGGVFAQWIDGIGLGDRPNCRSNFGLRLQKSVPTAEVAAAGAILQGIEGAVVTDEDTLGYDIRNDSPCLAGSPRFNVTYTLPDGTEGFSFVGGCANGTITPSPQDPNWNRVTFDLQSDAFPSIPIGSVIESVVLIVDDQGTYILDNIQFRDLYFDGSGRKAGNEPRCSFVD
jgi:hypothetical protein